MHDMEFKYFGFYYFIQKLVMKFVDGNLLN